MSLQMPVTEDTPPDMLSGAMDLNVILPNGSVIKMSVERSTPMMDLLVQITTAHKLSPGSHAIHAIGDRGVLPYKPSTPIGALDTWTVNIVPKSSSKNGRYQSQSIIKCISKPFEQTFRLQVHLPRNQLYVARISPKTLLNSILKQVCSEKNLDPAKYTLRKPDKLNEPLDLSKTLVEYKLQQLSLVLNTNRALIGGLSSDDIMSRAPKKFSCDDSLSSGSLGGRSLSPTRSDESSDTPRRPLMVKVLPSRPVRKRRLAPKPPSQQQQQRNAPAEQTIISHSRNSSDSSGYHESSVLSDAVDCNAGRGNIDRPGKFSPSKTSGPNMSRSMTNLQACGQNQNQFSEIPFTSNNIGQSKHFASTTSLVSMQSRKKKAAPPPPLVNKPKLAPPQEEPESEPEVQRKSQTLPVTAKPYTADAQEKSKTVSRIELNNNVVEPNLSPATSSLSSLSRSDVDRDLTVSTSPTSSIVIGSKRLPRPGVKSKRPAPKPPMRSSTVNRPDESSPPGDLTTVPRLSSGSTADEDDELRMDDEEIDRIFGDATSGYDTPSVVTVKETGVPPDVADIDWEYKLPDPPSAFRDDDRSPTVTMFDTVTIGGLADVVFHRDESVATDAAGPVAEAADRRVAVADADDVAAEDSVKKIIGDEYHCFPQDSGVGSDDSSLPSSCEEKLHADDKPPAKTTAAAEPKEPSDKFESKLNNFKIVAYDEDDCCTRPTEIFCDESVKTWKTTQKARESNPAYKLHAAAAVGSVNRHKSFSVDRGADRFAPVKRSTSHVSLPGAGNGTPVRRSTSHISLLSGNITPSNRLAKHYVGRTYSSERLDYDDERLFKRSFSVGNIAEDARESSQDEDYEKDSTQKKLEPTLEQSSPLHSLQILKTILPQIEEHKPKENVDSTDSSFDTVSVTPPSVTEFAETEPEKSNGESRLERDPFETQVRGRNAEHRVDPWEPYAVVGANRREVSSPQNPAAEPVAVDHRVRSENERSREPAADGQFDDRPAPRSAETAARTTDDRDEPKTKRYSYAGPPKISLSTWNERPKRQVSIKTDRDYVIGIRQRMQQKAGGAEPTTRSKDYCASGSRHAVDDRCAVTSASTAVTAVTATVAAAAANPAVSRVPVVKSVELKKPYAEQLQTASPVLALAEAIKAQAKLSNGYGGYLRGAGGNAVVGGYRGTGPTAATAVTARADRENATAAAATPTRPSEKKKEHEGGAGGSSYTFGKLMNRPRKPREISVNVDPRENLLASIRSFGGRDNLRKIRG